MLTDDRGRTRSRGYAHEALHSRGLHSLGAFLGVVLDRFAVGQRLVALAFDHRVMNEDVAPGLLGCDEAEALLIVEPLHLTRGHASHSFPDVGAHPKPPGDAGSRAGVVRVAAPEVLTSMSSGPAVVGHESVRERGGVARAAASCVPASPSRPDSVPRRHGDVNLY